MVTLEDIFLALWIFVVAGLLCCAPEIHRYTKKKWQELKEHFRRPPPDNSKEE